MITVKACKKCGCSVEANTISNATGKKVSLSIEKCPLCGGELVDDDAENYY